LIGAVNGYPGFSRRHHAIAQGLTELVAGVSTRRQREQNTEKKAGMENLRHNHLEKQHSNPGIKERTSRARKGLPTAGMTTWLSTTTMVVKGII
jgi:hypothetical protein